MDLLGRKVEREKVILLSLPCSLTSNTKHDWAGLGSTTGTAAAQQSRAEQPVRPGRGARGDEVSHSRTFIVMNVADSQLPVRNRISDSRQYRRFISMLPAPRKKQTKSRFRYIPEPVRYVASHYIVGLSKPMFSFLDFLIGSTRTHALI